MKIIKINLKKPESKILKQITKIIKQDGVVAFPSDTCYGLAADATSKRAVKKVFKIKKRPSSKPISIIIQNLKMAKQYAQINQTQEQKLKKYLPGPYTIILPTKMALKKIFTETNKTISIRIPDSPLTRAFSSILKIPYTATSANLSGQPPAWSAQKVIKIFQNQKTKPDLILDGGQLKQKPLSIIINLASKKPKILKRS